MQSMPHSLWPTQPHPKQNQKTGSSILMFLAQVLVYLGGMERINTRVEDKIIAVVSDKAITSADHKESTARLQGRWTCMAVMNRATRHCSPILSGMLRRGRLFLSLPRRGVQKANRWTTSQQERRNFLDVNIRQAWTQQKKHTTDNNGEEPDKVLQILCSKNCQQQKSSTLGVLLERLGLDLDAGHLLSGSRWT